MLRLEMQELNAALTRTRTRHQEIQARYVELAKVRSDNPDELPASELLASQFLQTLRTHYQDALKERMLRAYLTEGQAIGEPDVLAPVAQRSVDLLGTEEAGQLVQHRGDRSGLPRPANSARLPARMDSATASFATRDDAFILRSMIYNPAKEGTHAMP